MCAFPLCAGLGSVVLCDSTTSPSCGDYGTCVVEHGHVKCLCSAGYNGTNCEDEVDLCVTRGCENGGTCTVDTKLTCECPFGYNHFYQCSEPFEKYQLCKDPQICKNNGTCSYPVPIPEEGLPYVCDCTPGWLVTTRKGHLLSNCCMYFVPCS